ncbi:MAG: C45 family autoproteolytic acyltransferase/hydrolase [Anaerolineae bacterium]
MRVLELAGTHYEMGRQHGHQIRDLRPIFLQAVDQRLAKLAQSEADVQPLVTELRSAWEVTALPTVEMLRGIADALELEWDPFFRYTIASYLEDRRVAAAHAEGCTAWAAAAPIARDGTPILAKNRDYRLAHLPLQCLARARPAEGYRYAYVTSAGSPAVFSSGMNEAGLAVADTHVTSLDIGPGVARYSVEMACLEYHDSVKSALDYLRGVSHIGDGTLVVADATGDVAVFEAGHAHQGVIHPKDGFVVSTNHFVTELLRDQWVDRNPADLRGNSERRHARVTAALQAAQGQVGAGWAQALMTSHGRSQDAICRHPEIEPHSATISTVLYFPEAGEFLFANGRPCQAKFHAWSVI